MLPQIKKAVAWFQKAVHDAKSGYSSPVSDLKGQLLLMTYNDPKYKDTLPYYDENPLIFVIDVTPKHIFGINVHYLHPFQRKILINNLMDYVVKDADRVKLDFSYSDSLDFNVSNHVKVCLKKYEISRIKNWMIISPFDWSNILYLPIYKFQKASVVQVWKESREKL